MASPNSCKARDEPRIGNIMESWASLDSNTKLIYQKKGRKLSLPSLNLNQLKLCQFSCSDEYICDSFNSASS